MSLPEAILKCQVVACVPEEMRWIDVNPALDDLGFRDAENFDNVADLVAHVCAGTTQVLFAVVDQEDDTVADQIDFIRLISSRLIIVRLVNDIERAQEELQNLTPYDILVDYNEIDDSILQVIPFLKDRAASVTLYQQWIASRKVTAVPDALVASVAKSTHVKDDLIKQNPDNLNLQGAFIGRGALGDVFQCNCTLISKPMAAKNIDTKKLSPALLKSLERELAVLTKLPPNPHLIRFFWSVEPTATTNRKLYLELCKTSVQSVMKGGIFPFDMAKTVIQHLVKGLEFLHANNIVHRDVKPDNILVAYDGIYKIADLGSSIEADPVTKLVTEKQDLAGTLKYMAPEVFNGHAYGTSADVWSVGIVLMDLIGQGLPSNSLDVVPSFFNPDRPDDKSPVPLPLTLPKDVSNFLVMCLQRDASLRATPSALLESAFLKGPALSAKNVSQFVGKAAAKSTSNHNASAVVPSLAGAKNVNLEALANSCSHSDVLSFLAKK